MHWARQCPERGVWDPLGWIFLISVLYVPSTGTLAGASATTVMQNIINHNNGQTMLLLECTAFCWALKMVVGERQLRQFRNGNHSSWEKKAVTLGELKHSRAPVLFSIDKQEGKEITWAVPPGPCGTAGGTRRDVQEDRLRGTQGWLTWGLSASWKLWNQKEKSKCRAELPSAEWGGLSVAGSAHCGLWGWEAVAPTRAVPRGFSSTFQFSLCCFSDPTATRIATTPNTSVTF